jgi:AraC-like DNA-binding protein
LKKSLNLQRPTGNHLPSRFVCLETRDVDELSAALSWNRRHNIERLSFGRSYRATVSHVALGNLNLGFLTAHGFTRDHIGPADADFALLIPFVGTSKHTVTGKSLPLTPTTAALHSPGRPAELTANGHIEILSLGLKEAAVVAELEQRLQRSIRTPIQFSPRVDLGSLGGALLRSRVLELCHILDSASKARLHRLGIQQIERALISHLIDAQPHNHTRMLHRFSPAGPWQVRCAEAFIQAHAHEPLTLGDLASLTGVSARSLEYSFRRSRGYTPMEFLRNIRFERAHSDLRLAAQGISVSAVAAKWGFLHFGRFARDYGKRFGELPSATLHRSRSAR